MSVVAIGPTGRSTLIMGAWLALAIGAGMVGAVDPRIAAGAVLVVFVGTLCFARPHSAIALVAGFAALVSGLRRVATYYFDTGGDIDPLLAVVPAAAVALALVAWKRGAAQHRTRLGNLMVLLTIIAVAGSFNPLQGSPSVGIVGFAFFGAPLLWFWVGRQLVDDAVLATVFRTVGVLALVIAVYGLVQISQRFPGWDRLWLETVAEDFTSLRLDGEFRPFATLTGPGEFARFLALGLVVWIVGSRFWTSPLSYRVINVVMIGVLGTAMLLAAVRGPVVMLVLGLGAIAAARRRIGASRAAVVGALSLGLLIAAANVAMAAGLASGKIGRQIEGFATPFSSETSTVDKRFGLFTQAMADAFTDPIGRGTGVTTPAASRLGDTRALNSEADLGDVALSWGLAGLMIYAAIVVLALITAYRLASHRGDWLSFSVLGVLFAAGTQWINGGLYSLAPLVWLAVGWADRSWQDVRNDSLARPEPATVT